MDSYKVTQKLLHVWMNSSKATLKAYLIGRFNLDDAELLYDWMDSSKVTQNSHMLRRIQVGNITRNFPKTQNVVLDNFLTV